jgi:hypothetical protein
MLLPLKSALFSRHSTTRTLLRLPGQNVKSRHASVSVQYTILLFMSLTAVSQQLHFTGLNLYAFFTFSYRYVHPESADLVH